MFKSVQEIKDAVSKGEKVYWSNPNYEVIKDSIGQYLIHSKFNDYYFGLTHRDGETMNEKLEDFFKE